MHLHALLGLPSITARTSGPGAKASHHRTGASSSSLRYVIDRTVASRRKQGWYLTVSGIYAQSRPAVHARSPSYNPLACTTHGASVWPPQEMNWQSPRTDTTPDSSRPAHKNSPWAAGYTSIGRVRFDASQSPLQCDRELPRTSDRLSTRTLHVNVSLARADPVTAGWCLPRWLIALPSLSGSDAVLTCSVTLNGALAA
ncbi:hypothetical protein BD311DRAFT_759403 [Dichomitus squalens]|uniref:Uncharacterized protein n=1 Tax=Dichomitus squalens TaxID=114155 RepID=A0A4Q9MPI0_9APHY|nr:hypothetical protein BD311DRAFT_759403 [Dichomitus squalens]